MRNILIGAMALVLIAGLVGAPVYAGAYAELSGKKSTAWFGIETPAKRMQRSAQFRMIYPVPDFPPLSLRLPASDDPYTDITGQSVHDYLARILEITEDTRPEGERFWGRIAGSASEVAVAEYVAGEFERFGLADVSTETVQGKNQWWPLDWQVTLLARNEYGRGSQDMVLNSAFPAIQLEKGALSVDKLEAELVFVGHGHPLDLIGRDIEGKIAVVHADLQIDPFFQTARGFMDGVVEAGAAGVLIVIEAPGNHQYALEEMGPPEVPILILGGDDGHFLEDVMAAGAKSRPITARIKFKTTVREPWQGKNVIGIVTGQTDEYLIVVAHLDGYFSAANDNGAGVASMIALAEHYARPDVERPQRNILFLGSSGHHEFSDGVEGFIANHQNILDKTVLVFNVEHPSSVMSYLRGQLKFYNFTVPAELTTMTTDGPRSLTISNGNKNLLGFYRDAIDRYGLAINSRVSPAPPTGDAFGFFKAGQAVVQILDANLWYHSSGDTLDSIHANGLERATRLYAEVLDRIDATATADLQ